MGVAVRTYGKPESALTGVRRKLRQLDAELPLSNVRSMEQWLSNNAAPSRLNAFLLSPFACVALAGLAAGLLGALALSRGLASLLFGVNSHDPATFSLVAVLLAVVAAAACFVPARKAASLDPILALRESSVTCRYFGSVGSTTLVSRSQPSFSSLMCWIATPFALASRLGRA